MGASADFSANVKLQTGIIVVSPIYLPCEDIPSSSIGDTPLAAHEECPPPRHSSSCNDTHTSLYVDNIEKGQFIPHVRLVDLVLQRSNAHTAQYHMFARLCGVPRISPQAGNFTSNFEARCRLEKFERTNVPCTPR